MTIRITALALLSCPIFAAQIGVPGLQQPVEILRDRWGVPHIYAQNAHDLFFAQGYITAGDRLFQIDLWRRIGTGHLAEVLGPQALARDTLARAVRYRGNMDAEWQSYGPNAREIVAAFTDGINAYIRLLRERPPEFAAAGYDPAFWAPEDCLARIAGLLMTRNLPREVQRAVDVKNLGARRTAELFPPDPRIPVEVPKGLDLEDITPEILRVYNEAIGPARFAEQGSNNWVVDGTMTVTGKPILANDPHRPIQIPSLRKTVHLVAPGWNAIGAGEPALPGIALGHNDRIAFGFTIVGIDQCDLYVEKINPENPAEYRYRGTWKRFDVVREPVAVRGRAEPEMVELRYTVHGPVIHEDRARNRAYALKWVGSEPGSAGYLAGLSVARARNWDEFTAAMERYKVPSENIVYADVDGNIGWQAAGMAPVRQGWSGLLPVPGDTGEFEWSGFRRASDLPRTYNPATHFIATANHNILPPGYKLPLGYEWALPFRYFRIREMLVPGQKFSVADFERMQQDVTSVPARRLQRIVRRSSIRGEAVESFLGWDARVTADSRPALLYELWATALPAAVFGTEGAKVDLLTTLDQLERHPSEEALRRALGKALLEMGPQDRTWGSIHTLTLRHPLGRPAWSRGPIPRPGDGNTVNAASGNGFTQTNGASYREILDLGDWDRSVMTNVPGESGNPGSAHYSDLLEDWAAGRYHPMPFSRKAVEAATEERILLEPASR